LNEADLKTGESIMDCLGKRDKTFDEYILREDTKQASYGLVRPGKGKERELLRSLV